MTLRDYIDKHGKEKCAKKWRVSVRTVEYWYAGTTIPQRTKLPLVLETTGLTHSDIYATAKE